MKTYEELISELSKYDAQIVGQELPPHSTNLMHQLNKRVANNIQLFNDVCSRYFKFRESAQSSLNLSLADFVSCIVDKANNYMDYFVVNNPFSHQQDFTSSIVPEMLYFTFKKLLESHNCSVSVYAQQDLPIECMFDLYDGGRLVCKNKRLDLSLSQKTTLTLNETSYDFYIPLVAMEIKTNLDKNMLAGIENSVASLKKTFPKCMYFVVSEFADFDSSKLNYASSDIDEIFIIRNQKRADIRDNKNPKNAINKNLVLELASNADKMLLAFMRNNLTLEEKMRTGKLI